MFAHRFLHAVGNLDAVAVPARLVRVGQQAVAVTGARVEEHWAAEVCDLQRGEVLLPAAEPVPAAAVQDADIDLPVLVLAVAWRRSAVVPAGNQLFGFKPRVF